MQASVLDTPRPSPQSIPSYRAQRSDRPTESHDREEGKIFIIANTCIGIGALAVGTCALVKSPRCYKIIQRGDACLLGLILLHTGLSFYVFNPGKAASIWFACKKYLRRCYSSAPQKRTFQTLCLLALLRNRSIPKNAEENASSSPQDAPSLVDHEQLQKALRTCKEEEGKEDNLVAIAYLTKLALKSLFFP